MEMIRSWMRMKKRFHRAENDSIETKVDDWEFRGLFGVLLVDNVEEQRRTQPFRWRCFLLDIVLREMVTYLRCVSSAKERNSSSQALRMFIKQSHGEHFHYEDVNKGKHLRTSSFKERGNDDDMIQELAEEEIDHLERDKSKGTAKNK
ncbi:hypothetical protein Tco_0527898 [Tanacetum coccineum]